MTDKVFSATATEIPGMRVTYQIAIGDGRTVAYEAAVDSTIAREDLDELLDRCGDAAERRQAVFELPLVRASLWSNRQLLATERVSRARAQAESEGRVAQLSRGRRADVPLPPSDVNRIAQYDARLLQIEAQIKSAEARIPYLEAIIARREPPDLFPELAADMREAAE